MHSAKQSNPKRWQIFWWSGLIPNCPAQIRAELWIMYFDGLLMKTGADAGLLFVSPLRIHMHYVI
jgi:hypothetical protein